MPNVMIYVFKVKFPSISYKNYAQLVFNFKMPDLRWFFGIRPKKSTSKFNFEVEFTVLIRIPWESTVEFDQKSQIIPNLIELHQNMAQIWPKI